MLGDGNVGKTSSIKSFMDEKLIRDYLATIGVDVTALKIAINNNVNKKETITLSVWDMAGQKRYQQIRMSFYLGAAAGFLIFDLTNKSSFDNLSNWINEVERIIVNRIPFFLVGNKMDLPNRAITKTQMQQLQKQYKSIITIYETSALTGEGIKDLFQSSTELIYSKLNPLPVTTIITTPKKTTKKVTKKSGKKVVKKAKRKPKKTTKKATKKSGKKVTKKTKRKPKPKKKAKSKKITKKK